MSLPTKPNAATKALIDKAIEENEKAGDWVYSGLPYSPAPTPDDQKLTPEDIVSLTANTKVPKKK